MNHFKTFVWPKVTMLHVPLYTRINITWFLLWWQLYTFFVLYWTFSRTASWGTTWNKEEPKGALICGPTYPPKNLISFYVYVYLLYYILFIFVFITLKLSLLQLGFLILHTTNRHFWAIALNVIVVKKTKNDFHTCSLLHSYPPLTRLFHSPLFKS